MTDSTNLNHQLGRRDHAASGRPAESLDTVYHSVVRLVSAVPSLPKRIRVEFGDVVVEVEWPSRDASAEAAPSTVAAVWGPDGGAAVGPITVAEASTGKHGDVESGYLCAPTVGTFYRSPEPGAEPFVREQDIVRTGQQVGIIEVMKLMLPIEADVHGRVVEILVRDATPVEYGERLFRIVAVSPEQRAG